MKKISKTILEDRFVDVVVYTILVGLTITIILPFLQVITLSMSPADVVNKTGFHIIPEKFNFLGYMQIATHDSFWWSYLVTIVRTLIGTFFCVLVTILTAYPLSKEKLPFRKYIMIFIVFTMYFKGGVIPRFLLIKQLGLLNNFMVYILPELITGFALIITRNFFMEIPNSLEEAAKIDGASNMKVLFSVYLPVSKPVVATISLWYAVYHWNAWVDNLFFVTNEKLFTLQYMLRNIILSGQNLDADMDPNLVIHTETMKMAALVLSIIPIVSIYPFIQKYFVKGMLVGSVKG